MRKLSINEDFAGAINGGPMNEIYAILCIWGPIIFDPFAAFEVF